MRRLDAFRERGHEFTLSSIWDISSRGLNVDLFQTENTVK